VLKLKRAPKKIGALFFDVVIYPSTYYLNTEISFDLNFLKKRIAYEC